jgi:molybdopterin-guanine dinucleotide biosynthesis protein A
MYHCSLLPVLQKQLQEKELKMMSLLHAAEPLMLDQSHFDRPDRFANINKKEDLTLLNKSKFQQERSL